MAALAAVHGKLVLRALTRAEGVQFLCFTVRDVSLFVGRTEGEGVI